MNRDAIITTFGVTILSFIYLMLGAAFSVFLVSESDLFAQDKWTDQAKTALVVILTPIFPIWGTAAILYGIYRGLRTIPGAITTLFRGFRDIYRVLRPKKTEIPLAKVVNLKDE